MTIGYGLSLLGVLFFLLGLGQILDATVESACAARCLLQIAGWFTSAGWLLQRAEAGPPPFGRSAAVMTAIRKTMSDVCLPLALLALLFLSVVLLLAVMFVPFVIFIVQKLL